jgi:hypothetical protein
MLSPAGAFCNVLSRRLGIKKANLGLGELADCAWTDTTDANTQNNRGAVLKNIRSPQFLFFF